MTVTCACALAEVEFTDVRLVPLLLGDELRRSVRRTFDQGNCAHQSRAEPSRQPVTAIGRAESLWCSGCRAGLPTPSRSATDAYRIWRSPSRRSVRLATARRRVRAQHRSGP